MAVIGATQLEPVNVLGQYVQGLEAGRATTRQRAADEAAMLEAQRAAELRNFLSATPDLMTPKAQNQLLRFGKPGAEMAASLADISGKRATARKTNLEIAAKGVEMVAREAGGFLANPSALNKATLAPWVQSAVQRGILQPEDTAKFDALPDDPTALAAALQQLQTQGMSLADQLRYQRPEGTTRDVGGMIVTVDPFTGKEIGSLDYTAAEQAARAKGAPRTQVSTTNVQERAEAGEFGKALVADYTAIRDRAESGRRFLTTIDQAQRALSEGLRTGFGADAVRQGARVLAALGEPEAEAKAANAELFLAAGKENVLRRQIEQKGPQTESDAARIEETFISLGTTPQANQFMLDVARAQIKRDGEQQRFYSKWRRDNGTFDGAEEAWLDSEGGKSLFDRPELKKYAAKGAGGDEPVRVQTVEEARALSPGTRFITPDGRIKVR